MSLIFKMCGFRWFVCSIHIYAGYVITPPRIICSRCSIVAAVDLSVCFRSLDEIEWPDFVNSLHADSSTFGQTFVALLRAWRKNLSAYAVLELSRLLGF